MTFQAHTMSHLEDTWRTFEWYDKYPALHDICRTNDIFCTRNPTGNLTSACPVSILHVGHHRKSNFWSSATSPLTPHIAKTSISTYRIDVGLIWEGMCVVVCQLLCEIWYFI